MKIFVAILLYVVPFLSLPSSSNELFDCVELRAIDMKDEVSIIYFNGCVAPVEIWGNFELGGRISMSSLSVTVMGSNLIQHKVNGVIDSRLYKEKVRIQRNHFYGTSFSKELIALYFGLPSGEYKLKAEYLDRGNNPVHKLESEWIGFQINN